MFRVSVIEETAQQAVLRLEGRLLSQWLLVLENECRDRLRLGKSIVLDFAGVTTIDERSALFVKALQDYEVEVVNPSVLARNLLSMEDP